MRADRVQFVEKELMVNYPDTSKFVIDMIKKELKIGK